MTGTRERALILCLAALLAASGSIQAAPGGGSGGGKPGGGSDGPAPVLSFAADRSEYQLGDRAQLSWASSNTKFCNASGDWEGKHDSIGTFWTTPLDGPKTFHLKCAAKGGGVSASVSVAVFDPEPEPVPEPVPMPTPEPTPEPTLSFSASDVEIMAGESTTLSWSATDAEGCEAGDGWAGSYGSAGSEPVGPLDVSSTFSLLCAGPGGTVRSSVQVAVTAPAPEPTPEPAPAPMPTVTLNTTDSEVAVGGSTTLSWSASDADSCQASGGWSGTRGSNGSEVVGPIAGSTTFSLSCSGTGGNAMQMVSVSAIGEVSINWIPPEENVDGSPLTDLERYRIYYGPGSRSYSNSIDVTDPAATSHMFSASSGEYFVTMTAVDIDGNESVYSNEILRSVP